MKNTGMKIIIVVMALVLTPVFIAFAKEKIAQSTWAASQLAIDGLVNDWEADPLNEEKKVKAEYAFRNDSDFLYVLFKFNDLKYLSSIEISGMTLWVDTEGKKDKKMGIRFTQKKISADEYISLLEKQQGTLSDEQKKNVRASAFYFISQPEMVDKKGNPLENEKASEAVKGAAFNVSAAQEAVTYEFRLPLKSLAEALLGSGTKADQTIGVGFEWGGLTDEMRKEFMKGSTGEGSGAMGISEGGRGGGGAQGVGFDGASPAGLTALRQMTKKYSFWTAVSLAGNQ
jgi:hypothetical protein